MSETLTRNEILPASRISSPSGSSVSTGVGAWAAGSTLGSVDFPAVWNNQKQIISISGQNTNMYFDPDLDLEPMICIESRYAKIANSLYRSYFRTKCAGRHPVNELGAFTNRKLENRAAALLEVINAALEMVRDAVEEGEMGPPNVPTWSFALQSLAPMILASNLTMPLFLPLQGGGLGAEWHDQEINIELRFRGPYQVYCLIEDARAEVNSYSGSDPHLHRATEALAILRERLLFADMVRD